MHLLYWVPLCVSSRFPLILKKYAAQTRTRKRNKPGYLGESRKTLYPSTINQIRCFLEQLMVSNCCPQSNSRKKNLVSECLTLAQEEDLTLLISSVLCNIHSPLNVPYKTLSNLIIFKVLFPSMQRNLREFRYLAFKTPFERWIGHVTVRYSKCYICFRSLTKEAFNSRPTNSG